MRHISKKKLSDRFLFFEYTLPKCGFTTPEQAIAARSEPSITVGAEPPITAGIASTEDNRFSNPAVIIQYHLWFKMSTDMVRD